MRKNILIFGHGYATQFIDINNQYSKLFDKNQFKVTVVYLTGEPNDAVKNRHVAEEIIFLNSPKKSVRGLKLDAIKKMLSLCREHSFEIVICHRYKPTYVMLWVSQLCRIPKMISVMHELGTLRSWARRSLIALLARDNVFFAGVSNAVRDDLRKSIWRIPPKRVVTLYNSIDVPDAERQLFSRIEARDQLHLPHDAFVFGTLGRLVVNKNQESLILAFSHMKRACPRAKLIILGDGQLESSLKRLTDSLGLKNDVIFAGYIDQAFRYLKAFDVFVSSSIQEAFGMVLIEAMVAKVPIIATKVNGIPEVVDQSGVLVPPRDAMLLGAEMLKVYQLDEASRMQWGERGYQRVNECFSLGVFGKSFWDASGSMMST